jgi:hypothetical protein
MKARLLSLLVGLAAVSGALAPGAALAANGDLWSYATSTQRSQCR